MRADSTNGKINHDEPISPARQLPSLEDVASGSAASICTIDRTSQTPWFEK